MATLQPGLQFTGSIGNISAYEMKSTGKIILRTKGGPSKAQIKTKRNFARTRENNMELGGRSRAAKWIKHSMGSITALTNLHLGNALQPLVKTLQYQDTVSPRGQRNIYFSKAPSLLPGFAVNNRFALEQLVTSPIRFEMDVTGVSAKVYVPALIPGLNLLLPPYAPLFGFVASLGVLPDVMYTPDGYVPDNFNMLWPAQVFTPWMPTIQGCAAQELPLQLTASSLPAGGMAGHTLVLSVGIRLGKPGESGTVHQHRYAGAGKIMEAVVAAI